MPRNLATFRVAQLFSWGADNPYQELLASALAQHEIEVDQPQPRLFLLPSLFRGGRRPDVVHVQSAIAYFRARSVTLSNLKVLALVAQLWAMRLCGAKIVWTAHDTKKHGVRSPRQERRVGTALACVAHAIIVHCPAAVQEVGMQFGIGNRSKLHVIPHGNYVGAYADRISPGDARAKLGLASEKIVLLCLGLLHPYKGIERLVSALEKAGPNLHLVIAGKPISKEYAAELGERVAHASNVTYSPRFVPVDDIQVYMRAADAVVFAYPEILTSGALVLAMSFAKACVAPGIGCIPEMLDPQGGIIYDARGADGLAAALRQVVQRCDDLPLMGARNLERVRQWSWDRVAAMTLDVYRSCMAGRTV